MLSSSLPYDFAVHVQYRWYLASPYETLDACALPMHSSRFGPIDCAVLQCVTPDAAVMRHVTASVHIT